MRNRNGTGPGGGRASADSESASERVASCDNAAAHGVIDAEEALTYSSANLADIFGRRVGLKRGSLQVRALNAHLRTLEQS